MSEISEGDKVITPEGEVDQVVRVTEIPDPCGPQVWLKERELGLGQEKLVKTSEPIRVRVSREKQAEDLVALAREFGFRVLIEPDGLGSDFNDNICLTPDNDGVSNIVTWTPEDPDLTYRDDLPQIEAWLQANAESEEECVCDENNQVIIAKDKEIDCPDCTDESEEYDEPRPEDEERSLEDDETRELFYEDRPKELINDTPPELEGYIKDIEDQLFRTDLDYNQCLVRGMQKDRRITELQEQLQDVRGLCHEYGLPEDEPNGDGNEVKLTEFIRSQFQELEDVREERDELRKLINSAMDDDIDTVFDDRDNLQERIDEARDYVKNSDRSQIAPTANTDLLEILSQDSDEGDGCS